MVQRGVLGAVRGAAGRWSGTAGLVQQAPIANPSAAGEPQNEQPEPALPEVNTRSGWVRSDPAGIQL